MMLEHPPITDERIIACLETHYNLKIAHLEFLPIGADMNTAVFRALADDQAAYFVKLRKGNFDRIAVEVPSVLHAQGIRQIIAPIENKLGHLYTNLENFRLMLTPFIEGHNGFDRPLTDEQWHEFGRGLQAIHSVTLPEPLKHIIPPETFTPAFREQVREFQSIAREHTSKDPSATTLAVLLKDKQAQIDHLLRRAGDLAVVLESQPLEMVLCHADIHAGNLLMNDQSLYIVDWDQPVYAPRERDLMFIGAGIDGRGKFADEDARRFYEGYGQVTINPVALAYYRYERIVQDVVAYCEQIFLGKSGEEDRAQGLRQLTSQFQPDAVLDIAYRTEAQLPPALRDPFV